MFAGDSGDIDEDTAKELEHTYFQNSMDKELNELNRQLEKKEVLLSTQMQMFYFVGGIIVFFSYSNKKNEKMIYVQIVHYKFVHQAMKLLSKSDCEHSEV